MVAATIRLIELVGPKTWWWDEKKREPTKPPMITEAMTGVGREVQDQREPDRLRDRDQGDRGRRRAGPPWTSPRSSLRSSPTNGRRTLNMCEPIAATSSVSSVTLSMAKVSYWRMPRASAIFLEETPIQGV